MESTLYICAIMTPINSYVNSMLTFISLKETDLDTFCQEFVKYLGISIH